MPLIPPELIEKILSHLDGRKNSKTLQQTALVASAWLLPTRKRQFSSISLRATTDPLNNSYKDYSGLNQLFVSDPKLVTYIRELYLIWPGNADIPDDAQFFVLIRLLVESDLSIHKLWFKSGSHITDDEIQPNIHRFIQPELLGKLVDKVSGSLCTLVLNNPCCLFPLDLLSHIPKLTSLEISFLSSGCSNVGGGTPQVAFQPRQAGTEPVYLERLDIVGTVPSWILPIFDTSDSPFRFSRLKVVTAQAFTDDFGIWDKISAAKDSVESLLFSFSDYKAFPIKHFSKLRQLYVTIASDRLLDATYLHKWDDKYYPDHLKRFGFIMTTPHKSTSLPYFSEPFQETIDVTITGRIPWELHFDMFVLMPALAGKDVRKLNKDIRKWFLVLEENEWLGRCEVITGDKREFYKLISALD